MALGLFDGHYLIHRCLHVPSLQALSTKAGKPTGGVFGFIKSLRSTLYELPEIRSVVAVFDEGHSVRRKKLLPGYKVRSRNDEVGPDGLTYSDKLTATLRYLKFILPRLGVKVATLPGREGDDVIGLVVRKTEGVTVVISDDRDMLQLVDESTHVWRPLAEERVTLDNFEEATGWGKPEWLLAKCILGDSSDKIPGVHGVGPKTIQKVLMEMDHPPRYPFDDFFATSLMMTGKKINAIAENQDIVLRNYKLINLLLEEFTGDDIAKVEAVCASPPEFDVLAVKRFFVGLEFFSLVKEFQSWVVPFQLLK